MIEKLSFGCKSIDQLFDGGIKVNKPFAIFGRPQIGKTWMCMQISAYYTTNHSKKVLYIDTEGVFDDDEKDRMLSYFQNRWRNVKPENIEILDLRDIWELGEYLGMQVKISQSEKRTSVYILYPKKSSSKEVKSSFKSKDWFKYSQFWKDLNSGKYGIVILDSLSLPIKSEISRSTQDLPARATLQAPILGTLLSLSGKFNIPTIFTIHASVNPQGKSYDTPFGGADIQFYTKYIMGILPPVKGDIEARYQNIWRYFRRIWRYRYGFLEQKMIYAILAKDYGYTDKSYLSEVAL